MTDKFGNLIVKGDWVKYNSPGASIRIGKILDVENIRFTAAYDYYGENEIAVLDSPNIDFVMKSRSSKNIEKITENDALLIQLSY
jgi:hypothetical protein